MQRGIERVEVADPVQAITLFWSPEMKDDLPVLGDLLLSIARNDCCDFICSGQVVMMMISRGLQDNAGVYVGLLLQRLACHDLIHQEKHFGSETL